MSSSEEDEVYELSRGWLEEGPFEWQGGAPVDPEDLTLYFLTLFFAARSSEGKVEIIRVESPEQAADPIQAVMDHLTAPDLWPVVLRGLPNPSDAAWAYSPERGDYAGAVFLPPEPKKFRKKGQVAGVVRCPLPSSFRKVMQDLAPH